MCVKATRKPAESKTNSREHEFEREQRDRVPWDTELAGEADLDF